ncbi:MAG: hypothetical protein QM687_02465 [Ferruginibacter sp.]
MTRQITALMLLLAFALQTFNKAFIMVDYYANTGAYAKNCENKAKPKLHCNGKCQMMKKLKEEEKKEQQNPERKAENKNEIVLSSRSFFPVLSPANNIVSPVFTGYTTARETKMPRNIFHPPSIA